VEDEADPLAAGGLRGVVEHETGHGYGPKGFLWRTPLARFRESRHPSHATEPPLI
jgi:hypothetical protein